MGIRKATAAIALAGSASSTSFASAAAYDRSFAIADSMMSIVGSTERSGVLLLLPDNGLGIVALDFSLPDDYERNTRWRLSVLVAATGDVTCDAHFAPVLFARRRGGVQPAVTGGGSGTGMNSANGTATVGFTPNTHAEKLFPIERAASGTFSEMLPGDVLTVGLARNGTSAPDTCTGSVSVHGADVRYTVPPS